MTQAYLFNKPVGSNGKIQDLLPGGKEVEYYIEDGQTLNKGDYVCFEQSLDSIYFNSKEDVLNNDNLNLEYMKTLDIDNNTRCYYDCYSSNKAVLYSIQNYQNPKDSIVYNNNKSDSEYYCHYDMIKLSQTQLLQVGGTTTSSSSSSLHLKARIVSWDNDLKEYVPGSTVELTTSSDGRVGYINKALLLNNGQVIIFSSNYYRYLSVMLLCNVDLNNKTIDIVNRLDITDAYVRYGVVNLIELSNNKIALLYQDYRLSSTGGKLYKRSFTLTETTITDDNNTQVLIDSSYANCGNCVRFFEDNDGNLYYYSGGLDYKLSVFKILNPGNIFENITYNLMIDDIVSNCGLTLASNYYVNDSVYFKPIITYDKGFRWYFIIAESKNSYYIVSMSKTYNSENVGEVYHILKCTTPNFLSNLYYSELNISDDNILNLSICYTRYLYANLVQTVRLYNSNEDIMPLGIVTAVNNNKVKIYKFNQKYIDNFHDKVIFVYTPTSATNVLYINDIRVKPTRFNLYAIPDSETADADIGNVPYIYMLKYYYNNETNVEELKTLNSYIAGDYNYQYNSSRISYAYDKQNKRITINYSDSSNTIYSANNNYKFILEYWREPDTTPINLLS